MPAQFRLWTLNACSSVAVISLGAQGSISCMCALAWAPLTGTGRVGEAIPEGGLCGDACLAVALLGVRSCSVKDSPAHQHIAASLLPLPT